MIAPRRAQGGFTLIEVLVAIVLMAILSVVSWQGLDGVVRVRDHIDRDNERDQALLRVLGQIERDVRMRAPDYVMDGGNLTASAGPAPVLPSAMTVGRDGDFPLAVAIVRTPAAGPGAWQRVRWWREGDVLRRSVAVPGDEFPLPQPQDGNAVLDQVSDFSVRAYLPGRGWMPLPLEQANGTTAATGLEFTVAQNEAGQQQRRYRRVVSLP